MAEESKQDLQDDRHRVHEAAAAWYLRLREGTVTKEDATYRAWLAASPDHVAAMDRARATWDLFDDQAATPEMVKARRDALHRSGRIAARRWSGFRAIPGPVKALAAAAMIAFIALPGLMIWRGTGDPSPIAITAETYETEIGETRVVTLSDNSRVSLDASSKLRVRYSMTERDIELLQGQAHFDVAKDVSRPFRVTAGMQTVVATGTAFNVELVGEDVLVTLLEGEVVVTDRAEIGEGALTRSLPRAPNVTDLSAKPVKLKPGQLLVASATEDAQIVEDINLEKTNAWRGGKVFLEGDTLTAAVARMNRYSRITLTVADASLEELRISGVFNAGDTDAFVEAVEAYFPVDARRMSASRIELHRRS